MSPERTRIIRERGQCYRSMETKRSGHIGVEHLCLGLYNFHNFTRGTNDITTVAKAGIQSFIDDQMNATKKTRVIKLLEELSDIIDPGTESTDDQILGAGSARAHPMEPGIVDPAQVEDLEAKVRSLRETVKVMCASWDLTPQVKASLQQLSHDAWAWDRMIQYVDTPARTAHQCCKYLST
jgi:hypothetical protein